MHVVCPERGSEFPQVWCRGEGTQWGSWYLAAWYFIQPEGWDLHKMKQFPPSGLNYPFSKAARALLTVPFIVIFSQPSWPFATPRPTWALNLGTSSVRLQVAQQQDCSGHKGTREKEQLARWLGVCPDGAFSARPLFHWEGGLGIRFQWALAGQWQECARGGNSILHDQCLPVSCSLTAQFAFAGFMNRRLMTVAWVHITWKRFQRPLGAFI